MASKMSRGQVVYAFIFVLAFLMTVTSVLLKIYDFQVPLLPTANYVEIISIRELQFREVYVGIRFLGLWDTVVSLLLS